MPFICLLILFVQFAAELSHGEIVSYVYRVRTYIKSRIFCLMNTCAVTSSSLRLLIGKTLEKCAGCKLTAEDFEFVASAGDERRQHFWPEGGDVSDLIARYGRQHQGCITCYMSAWARGKV